jgi:hypothetical protein
MDRFSGFADAEGKFFKALAKKNERAFFQGARNGSYDFKLVNAEDFFDVPGVGLLDAGEFGNYFAGYVNYGAFGPLGAYATRAGGHLDSLIEFRVLDESKDRDLIDRGIWDYRRSHDHWGGRADVGSNRCGE